MTSPANSTTTEDGRFYTWRGDRFTSVTTILNTLGKSFLTKWAAKMAAEYAVDNWGHLTQLLIEEQKDEVIELIKGASQRYTTEASNLGTDVHAWVEAAVNGVLLDDRPRPLHIAHFNRWRDAVRPTFLACERTSYNRKHGYAGTMDILADIDGVTTIIDIKSGKRVYPEVALQLCAYARGEFMDVDGREEALPAIQDALVLHLRPNGIKSIPVRIDDEVWRSFLYVIEAYRWQKFTSQRVLGHDVSATKAW